VNFKALLARDEIARLLTISPQGGRISRGLAAPMADKEG